MPWEEIDVPRGQYIGWGNTPGQHVTGALLDMDMHGATTQAGDPCPLLEIELTYPAASFNKELQRVDFPPGEIVLLSVSQKQLQRAVKLAKLTPGDLVKIELRDQERTANGTAKIFGIAVDRGAALAKVNGQRRAAGAVTEFAPTGSLGGSAGPMPTVQSQQFASVPAASGIADDEPPF
jgi:hypothetical protein